ncbi:hypothetical protein IWQ61_007592 [Dispira simplex]|nr:hypothetical protein IWQ61_007592 [Dispira simplex]
MNNNRINTFRTRDERRLEDTGYDASNYLPMGNGDVVINGRGINPQSVGGRPNDRGTRMGRAAANAAPGQKESNTMTNSTADTGQYPPQSQRTGGLHHHEQVSGAQEINAQPMAFRNSGVLQPRRGYHQRQSPLVNTAQPSSRMYPQSPLVEADTMGNYGSGIGTSPDPDARSFPQPFRRTSQQTTQEVSTGDSMPIRTTAGTTNQWSTDRPQIIKENDPVQPEQDYNDQSTTANTRRGENSAGGANAGGGRVPRNRPPTDDAVGFSHVEGGSTGVAEASELTKGKQMDVAEQQIPFPEGENMREWSPAARDRTGTVSGEQLQVASQDTQTPEGSTHGYPRVGYSPKDDYRSTGHTYGLAGAMGTGRLHPEGERPQKDTLSPGMRYGVLGGRGKNPTSRDPIIPGADLDPNSTGHRYGLSGTGGVTSPEDSTTPLSNTSVRYGLAGSGGWELYDKETGQRTVAYERPARHEERPLDSSDHPMGTQGYRQRVDAASSMRPSSPATFPPQSQAGRSSLPTEANPNVRPGSPMAPRQPHQSQSTSAHHPFHTASHDSHNEPFFERPIGTTIAPPTKVPGSQYRENYQRDDTHPPGTTLESHPFPGDREKKRYTTRGSGSSLGESSGEMGPQGADQRRRHSSISKFRHRISSFFHQREK